MGNEVVALEDKADGVIAVGIPVAVAEFLGGAAGDDEIAACVLVKTADDVEHRCLAAAGRTENGNKFMRTEVDGNTVQRLNRGITDGIRFGNVL